MDEDFGDDAAFAAALDAAERSIPPKTSNTANHSSTPSGSSKVQQPKPQALPSRNAPSSILVATRQKGNPVLNHIHSVPWEYSDIPADYTLGNTTCALFLSLKYHRLHPEYIYGRIRALGQKYSLRLLLSMVDIANHEDALKELSKTSLINNLTLILCWSAQEAGRYLELFKSYEHANPSSIRAHQASGFNEKLVEFITVPRTINKTDAVGLISNFGSLKTAIAAPPEELGLVAGWGEKKVQQWHSSVRDPFRIRQAARRGATVSRDNTRPDIASGNSAMGVDDAEAVNPPSRPEANRQASGPLTTAAHDVRPGELGDEDEDALIAAAEAEEEQAKTAQRAREQPSEPTNKARASAGEEMSESLMAALARLRERG